MIFDTNTLILASVYLVMNMAAFIYMGLDKAQAINKGRRIPEAQLLFLSICFCALGVWLGMSFFRHKTRKIYFSLGAPLALAENLSLIYLIYIFIV